jgi:hypothetical protein
LEQEIIYCMEVYRVEFSYRACYTVHCTWRSIPKKEWTHLFIHTLDTIPKNWYLELEVHRETTDWEELTHNFKVTFSFEDDAPSVDTTLQVIKDNIFASEDSIELVPICSTHRYSTMVQEVLECYNVIGEDQEDEDPREIYKYQKLKENTQ